MAAALSLEAALGAEVAAWSLGGPALDFDAWALRIFRHQFDRNAPYRAFCTRRGVTPETIAGWEDVPAVPTAAFRRAELTCGGAEAVFRTSGTTTGGTAPGRHLVSSLALYRTAALATFERFVLPDGARLPALFLCPSPEQRPESSLARMCGWIDDAVASGSEWLVGTTGLDVDRLLARLAEAERDGGARLFVGVTAGFAALFEAAGARGRTFRLGPGSRIVDTGGAKGMTRPLSRAGFLRACWATLGVAGYWCVNEYGMTELCSQRYDSALRDRFDGRSLAPRRLVAPPWLRTRVLDPDTLRPVRAGAPGLLCHYDLTNLGSVAAVLTDDVGRAVGDDGIDLVGRLTGAPPRGCGLLLADLAAG